MYRDWGSSSKSMFCWMKQKSWFADLDIGDAQTRSREKSLLWVYASSNLLTLIWHTLNWVANHAQTWLYTWGCMCSNEFRIRVIHVMWYQKDPHQQPIETSHHQLGVKKRRSPNSNCSGRPCRTPRQNNVSKIQRHQQVAERKALHLRWHTCSQWGPWQSLVLRINPRFVFLSMHFFSNNVIIPILVNCWHLFGFPSFPRTETAQMVAQWIPGDGHCAATGMAMIFLLPSNSWF